MGHVSRESCAIGSTHRTSLPKEESHIEIHSSNQSLSFYVLWMLFTAQKEKVSATHARSRRRRGLEPFTTPRIHPQPKQMQNSPAGDRTRDLSRVKRTSYH